ncbi:non-ribosomal peptide synthase/polyketide synthase [Pseudomonas sp. FW300-N1B4]|uniref:non-ribosomal peptide synthase/polyketide synthase n=1 Tax=Pseudomonas sp. FW300-N1B4 TaxID=2751315 RepID=UPI001A91E5ED|nr:non-ribosomal peptide synthase/polyketide synthase [Pseudomonas sp. FW300-N1B4]
MQELIESVGQLSAKQRKALAVLLKQKGVNLFDIAPVFKRTAEEPLLLSYAQQRQWFLWQWAPHSAAYNIPTALRLQGPLDVAALQRSVQALIERHETLRTVFTQDAGQPLQTILPAGSFALDIHELSPELAANPQASIQAFVQTQSQQAFDLQTGPLLRAALLQVTPHDHVLVLTLHHIVSDGWSLQVMIEELVQLYAGFNLGHDAGLPALPIQYADYALWQRQWMEAGEQERQLTYWQQKLGDEQPVLELPTDRARPVEQSFAGASHNLILDPTLSDSLKAFARRENVTLFVLLLASFQALLHRYSGQADIRVGVPVANRGRVEIERLIGFFVNTQVLKADVDGQASFVDLLRQVRQTAQEAQAHQDLPFEQLVEALEPGRSLSHSPLFQVMFNHQAESRISVETRLNGLSIEPLEWQSTTAQFDLVLNTTEQAHGIEAVLKYATDLFEPATIERLAQHWQNLLRAIVQDPTQRIAQLPVLDDAQQQQLLAHWNPSPVVHPVSQCIHQLIEAQAERHPQAPAVVFAGQRLTYAELNRQANQWAHQLIARGVGPDVRVGVAVERSLDMIVAIVAVLKAGGAYVPLDPSYPDDRLRYMIEDSGIELLLTLGHLLAQLPIPPGLACLDLNQPPQDSSTVNPPCMTTADNLAYVIYTSGSTGKPKGALLPHGNVIRLFSATDHWFGFGPEDSWTLFHSYAFDFSVWEIFGALLYGGKLVVVPHDVTRSPEEFYTLLCDEQVTVLNQTPSAFKPLMQVASASSRNHALRYVVFGGEALEVQSLRPWFERFGDRAPTLINMYGITETTVHVTYRPLSMADLQQTHSSPIGQPIVDLSWYLLDDALNLVPQGCIGELYIAGAGLARGYLNQPGMSATRFVPDPFNPVAGERLYRTGDLARLRGDGVIEYIGRIDHQVKIRGFRIELGEIETQLLKHDAVREAVVLAVEGLSGQQLATWIVPSEPLEAQAHASLRDSIKAQLRESLPDYMVPVSWVFLDRLPLTANGKLDRKQLPNPDVSLVQEAYAAPRSELEQRLAEIWQDVLKVERVGLNDNFFELGGDSIISIQVVSRARQAGIRFSPKDIFQHQTVQRLATVAQQSDAVQAMQGDVLGAAVLTPIQQYFFATEIPQRQHWNQSILLTPAAPLQAVALEQALEHLQRHHDALRLRYRQTAGDWVQEHAAVDQPNALLRRVVLPDSEALPALCLELQRSLNLSDGPLIRAALVDLPDASQRLLLVIHHLVVDGVSWRILLEDLQTAYQQLSAGTPLRLPAKTTAFKDWGERLQGYARSAGLETELDYWREQLAEAPADLPLDNPDGQLQNRFERSVDTRLDAERTRQLLQQAPAVYRTQVNDLLLTALARVLCEWTASDSALVQLEGHGREDLFDDLDLSRTVGWFTSMFPVRLTPQASLEASIKGIKEQLRSIPNKGIGFEVLQDYAGHPVPSAQGRYRDFLAWLQRQDKDAAQAFWRGQLTELDEPTRLASACHGQTVPGPGKGVHKLIFDAAFTQRLNGFSRQQQVTLNSLVQAAWLLVLQRYTGQSSVAFGATVSGRPVDLPGIEQQLGLFINTLPVIASPQATCSVSDWVRSVQDKNLLLRDYEQTPLQDIQRLAALNGEALFDTLLVFENYPVSDTLEANPGGLRFSGLEHREQTNYGLTLIAGAGEVLSLDFNYITEHFAERSIVGLAAHLQEVLRQFLDAPQRLLGEIGLLPATELRTLAEWNDHHAAYPAQALIHQGFEAQVETRPQAIALRHAGAGLTYAELNRRANQLARHLQTLGVGAEVRVGVAMPRSAELVIALMAVLKAGGTYVPLDPDYPADRVAYMLDDSQARVLLTQQHLLSQLPETQAQVVWVEAGGQAFADLASHNLEGGIDSANLAYVIYTSGSTGKPKGVAIAHRNVQALIHWSHEVYSEEDLQGVLASTSVCFDLSVWEIFVTLARGGSIIMARNALELPDLPERDQVRLINTVPSAIAALQRAGQIPSGVRIINLAGEPLKQALVDTLYRETSVEHVYDLYGPSEDTTYSTCTRREAGGQANIGRPLVNTTAHLLDAQLQAAPIGVAAELYLAGDGITRGYLFRPGLTAERFVPNPLASNGERMYRTGDLTRLSEDGVIEYVGRIDHQVKVRGFRIELGEIEARLLAHDSVREGVVLAVEGHSGQQLVAYVVPTQSDLSPREQDDLSEALKAGLKAHLPDYMVPAQWLFIEQLPLTPNGKLDRKALPTPDANQLQRDYVAPRTALEQQIAGIWQDILKLERVGVTDNFFTLGGDSIISIQVVSRARQQGISFTPKDLFQQQTVQGLATVAQLGKALAPTDQGPVTGETPLLPIQQWFFEQALPQRHHWNQSVLLKPLNPLLAATLEQALHALIDHHDGLRLGFTQTPGGWSASYRAVEHQRLSPLWLESVSDAAHLERVAEQAQRSLDLQQGPLLRAVLFELPEGEQRLLLIVHHLVVDGVSWRILLEDLQGSYRQLLAGEPLALAAKTTSFKHWAEQLQTHARSESLLGQLPYWQAQRPDGAPLPQDNPQGSLQSLHALTLYSRLNPTLTRRLLQQTPAAYRTQVNDLLLTALARVIARWSEQSSVLIQLEGHGREDLFDGLDLTRTVGWFTSLFPVKLTPTQELAGSIKQIKEQLRAIPDRGIGYGVLRYLGDEACQASLRTLPTPRITFNYLGQFDGSFDSQSGALFVPSDEVKGAEHSHDALLGNWLTLNGQVYGGELSVGWSFSTQMFNASTIERLTEEYTRELELLIEHCCQPDSHGVTPSDFPLAHLDQSRLDALPIAPSRIEDIYPLSPMQEGMLFHTLSDNGSSLYVNQISLPVGGLDVERFRKAWEAVIERQAILRTSFHWHDGLAKPLQIVQRQATLDLQVLDWRDRDASEADIAARAAEDRARGFELTHAPLQRVLLIRSTEDQYQMVWTSHHILMDGWSSSRLFGEVIQHYAKGEISAENGRYRDFIAWLQAQDQDARELFWKARLAPVNEATALSQAIHPRHVSDEPGHNAIYSHWDAQQTGRLLQFCRDLRITPNTLIQGAWLLLLQRYTGKNTVTFGATVSGRPESLPNVGNMLGLFINTLPIIQTLEPDQPLADWLNRIQAYNLDIRDHSQAPLADVQRWSGLGGQALFDSIIVFENYPIDDRLQEDNDSGLSFGKSIGHDVTNVPMDLAVTLGDELSIEYLYLRSHFSAEAVEGIRLTLENTLEAMMRAPDERLGNLQRLSLEQWQAMQTWSAEPPADHQPQLLPELISRHALSQPEAIAVQCAGLSLSYGELERRANRLAHCLIEHGAGPEVVIGVALPRSLEMVVSFLAVLKSGAAYVPLDIDYPPERLAYMIEDSGMALLLTQSSLRATLPAPEGLLRLELDQLDESRYADEAPVCRVLEQGLAYLVYTSGSTGRPKGVAVTQGPLSMHCQAIATLYEMDTRSCELHFMSFAFDGAHERWLSTLYSGGRLVVRDGCLWTPEQTYQALHEYGVTIACFPPAYLKQLAEYAAASGIAPPPVRIYCFGGDAVPDQTFEQVKAALRPEYFTNGYGPTETVVTPMLWKVPVSQQCEAAYAPIGRAVGARSLYVLDEELNPLPPGFAGELYIGGYGVARGYHGRPDLTCERFVPNPFASGERLYRTGDLVRLRQDGVVDYVGRIDHQVKVRGFRIELGEVEASLRQLARVSDALVIARDNASGKQLIGYVVTDAGQQLGDELKAGLRSTLPEYMVPAQIICLSAFPITPNGKLDRKALPEPEFKSEEYVAPRNQQEQLLVDIWAQVLQVEQVGISDNFFELGGDSILSLQVISRVRNHPTLQMDLKLRDLMRYQTIAGIVEQDVVKASTAQPAVDLTHVASEGLFNLLPIQEWFFAEGMAESHHYNQSFLLSARQTLDLDALEQALGWIENHHDTLRLRFCQEGGRWLQRYAAPTERREPVLWRREVENSEQVEALANLTQRSLKLDDGPAWRVVHIALPDGQARLLMVIHHLVVDTVSWRILLDDLKVAYEACVMGIEPQLPIRTSSYRAFAEALQAQAPVIAEQELGYWLEQLDQPGIDLPCDNRRGKNQVRHQAQARLKLSREHTEQLLKQAPAVYRTQINDLLLSALSRALCRWSEQSSALILLEGHGREDLFENIDLSRSLGWFTSMFPVRLTPDSADIGASIVNVQTQLAAIPQKGIGYGVLRHLAGPQLARQLADLPQARVTFNYLGQFDQSFDEQALLVPALEETGDNYSLQANLGNWLEIVGQVYDGQLALRCIYSSQRYRASTMELLMQDYQRELEALIEHCMARVG